SPIVVRFLIYLYYSTIPCSTFLALFFFFLLIPPPPRSTLFPYTTLFRSSNATARLRSAAAPAAASHARPRCAASPPSGPRATGRDRKSTRLNSSHVEISYAVFCLKKKKKKTKKIR